MENYLYLASESASDLVQATNFLADYNLFPITPNTSFFGHVLQLCLPLVGSEL